MDPYQTLALAILRRIADAGAPRLQFVGRIEIDGFDQDAITECIRRMIDNDLVEAAIIDRPYDPPDAIRYRIIDITPRGRALLER